MSSLCVALSYLLMVFSCVSGIGFVWPPASVPEKKVEARCTSYESLCGLNYRYITENGDSIQLLPSVSQICACANETTCNSDWNNMTNTVVQKLLTRNGIQLEAKISFCELPSNQTPCRHGDSVLVTKGSGQFAFELATPIKCNCTRPLVAHASWQDGVYKFIQYSCGQIRCAKQNTLTCAEMTHNDVGDFSYSYFCRCRRDEICMGEIPTAYVPRTLHTCHRQPRPRKGEVGFVQKQCTPDTCSISLSHSSPLSSLVIICFLKIIIVRLTAT